MNVNGMTPEECYSYAYNVLKAPFPEGEAVIATDTCCSHQYALDVLKGPFPEGEVKK